MPRVEVLGVEVPQFAGDNPRILVPRLVGQTEQTRLEKRGSRPRSSTDESTFLAQLTDADYRRALGMMMG
jgi:hypothetical protein